MRSLLNPSHRALLLARFKHLDPAGPPRWGRLTAARMLIHHAFFGPMTRQSWGYFCHRHFDYHLRQFGA